jgi:hypothetical protein
LSQRKKYDIEMQTLQTLSQKLAAKRPDLCDYACNLNADKIAILDLYISAFSDDPEFLEWLQSLREQLKRQGEALYLMHADILTNLGLKVGRTGEREIRGKASASSSSEGL